MRCKVILIESYYSHVPKDTLFINYPKSPWNKTGMDTYKMYVERCERVTDNNHSWSGSGIKTDIHHLYFLSDEELTIGNWCVDNDNNYFKIEKIENGTVSSDIHSASYNNVKKIIATTNKNLSIPLIPEKFIKLYVTKANSNSTIEEILVETYFDKVVKLKTSLNYVSIIYDRYILEVVEDVSYTIIDIMDNKIVANILPEHGKQYCKEIGEKILNSLNI